MNLKSSLIAMVLALSVAAVVGCQAKPEVVPSSGPRPPLSPDHVKIYQKPPLRYERLGVVAVPVGGDVKWDDRGNADAGFDRLREQAAARGGNGILLVVDRPEYYGRILAGYHDTQYQVPYRLEPEKAAVAEAIYVIKER